MNQHSVFFDGDGYLGRLYNIITLDSIRLAPRTHNPRIVERNDGYDINSLALDRGQVVDVAGEVLGGAARCEGAWDGEENDLLVGPFCCS